MEGRRAALVGFLALGVGNGLLALQNVVEREWLLAGAEALVALAVGAVLLSALRDRSAFRFPDEGWVRFAPWLILGFGGLALIAGIGGLWVAFAG